MSDDEPPTLPDQSMKRLTVTSTFLINNTINTQTRYSGCPRVLTTELCHASRHSPPLFPLNTPTRDHPLHLKPTYQGLL